MHKNQNLVQLVVLKQGAGVHDHESRELQCGTNLETVVQKCAIFDADMTDPPSKLQPPVCPPWLLGGFWTAGYCAIHSNASGGSDFLHIVGGGAASEAKLEIRTIATAELKQDWSSSRAWVGCDIIH